MALPRLSAAEKRLMLSNVEPSHLQRLHIISKVDEVESLLDALDHRDTSNSRPIEKLIEQLGLYAQVLAPIRRMPMEVLLHIFECLPPWTSSRGIFTAPLIAMHVCAGWRSIIRSTPAFWKDISVNVLSDQTAASRKNRQQQMELLRLSCDSEEVSLKLVGIENQLGTNPVRWFIIPVQKNLTVLHINGPFQFLSHFEHIKAGSLHQLTTLVFTVACSHHGNIHDSLTKIVTTVLRSVGTHFKSLDIETTGYPNWMPLMFCSDPHRLPIPWEQMRRIRLASPISTYEALAILNLSPKLEDFSIVLNNWNSGTERAVLEQQVAQRVLLTRFICSTL